MAESLAPVGPEFFRADLPLDELHPSPFNPRKRFDEARLQELAESVKGVGVIEPIVARPVNGHYEIVCGERRWRAARLAGLKTVPVIVKPLTDAQALEIMVIENNQREDVNPLEEADGFARLLATGYEIDKLAKRIGLSKKYIYDRAKLLDLVPEAKTHLLESRMTAGHAILIARLKPKDQERTIHANHGGLFTHQNGVDFGQPGKFDHLKPVTVRELEAWLADHVRFDVAHFAKAAPLDFGDTAANVQHALAEPGRGKKVIPITHDYNATREAASSSEERTYGSTSWKRADGGKGSKTCGHAVLGVVVAGKEYGRSFQVCIARDKCQVHWKAEIADRDRNAKRRASGQPDAAGAKAKSQHDSYMANQHDSYMAKMKREQAEEDRKRKAWDTVEARALTLLGEAVLKGGVTPRVVDYVVESIRFNSVTRKLLTTIVGTVTPQNITLALCIGTLLDNVYDFKDYLEHAKRFGVKTDAIAQEYQTVLAPPKPEQKAVQTSARAKSANKKPAKKKR